MQWQLTCNNLLHGPEAAATFGKKPVDKTSFFNQNSSNSSGFTNSSHQHSALPLPLATSLSVFHTWLDRSEVQSRRCRSFSSDLILSVEFLQTLPRFSNPPSRIFASLHVCSAARTFRPYACSLLRHSRSLLRTLFAIAKFRTSSTRLVLLIALLLLPVC